MEILHGFPGEKDIIKDLSILGMNGGPPLAIWRAHVKKTNIEPTYPSKVAEQSKIYLSRELL